MKRLWFVLLIPLLLVGGPAWAACSGASPSWSCTSWADFIAKANTSGTGLAVGDTVTLAAGTFTVSGAVAPVKKITVSGSGTLATILNASGNIFEIGTSGSRVTNFRMNMGACSSDWGAVNASHTGWRVDHTQIVFTGCKGRPVMFSNRNLYYTSGYVIGGLIDNNTFTNGNILVDGSAYRPSAGGRAYHSVPTVYGDEKAVYIEDNILTNAYFGNSVDANRSGSLVVRFNTFTKTCSGGGSCGALLETHGLQSTDERGPKRFEFYKNTITSSPSWKSINLRGATGVAWANTVTSFSGDSILIEEERTTGAGGGPSGVPCNGTATNWDSNEGPPGAGAGWLCRDAIGAGHDIAPYDGSYPLPAQVKMPAYFWQNSLVAESSAPTVLANRDFYEYSTATANPQTGGTRVGTKATMVALGCTTGVGFWVTNEGYWNSKTPGVAAGVLYKCTATNIWTPYYVPYPYPHPAQSGLAAPTGVK